MATVPHVLRGVFRFEKRIGAGGMGVVYRATDLNLKRDVAIKTLPRLTADHAVQLKREAQAMALLNHPNLAVIHGIESWRGTPFLVEEYLAGGTLADRLREGPMAVGEALEIGIGLAGVIGQLHASGIIHCDIKPSNIGFSQTGVMKLLDFGLAHLFREAGQVLTTLSVRGDEPGDSTSVVTRAGVIGDACLHVTRSGVWGVAIGRLGSVVPVGGALRSDRWTAAVCRAEQGRRDPQRDARRKTGPLVAAEGLPAGGRAVLRPIPGTRDRRSSCQRRRSHGSTDCLAPGSPLS